MPKFKTDDRVRVVKLENLCEAKIGDTGTIQSVDTLGPWLYYVRMDAPLKHSNHEWFLEEELESTTVAPPKAKRGKIKTTSDDSPPQPLT